MTHHSRPSIPRPRLQSVLAGIARIPDQIAAWRSRRRSAPAWTVAVAAIFTVVTLPLLTILILALFPEENIWPHLMRTVLPGALADTLILMTGVGALTLFFGTGTAWIITMYRFPGRAILDRLLVIPLAVPTYIVAYCYVEVLDFSGPVQETLRGLFGWTSVKDYWFPDIRSLPGAILIMSSVLYPYVYLSARASFVSQSVCALEVARTLGRTPLGAFVSVALPLARPALAAGVALGLMESLNDIGAVQYLGVQTLTVSIYDTWVQRSNLGGAAQIAAVMLFFIAGLFSLERIARQRGRYHHTTGRYRSIPFAELHGWRAGAAALACFIPFALGFAVPAMVLISSTLSTAGDAIAEGVLTIMFNSVMLATLAALCAVLLGLVLAYARRVAANGFINFAVRASGLGYAMPGTVLAIGLLIPLAGFDNWIDGLMRASFAISTGLLLSGSIFALTLAYTIRFLAVSLGAMEAGLERVSPNLDAAARTLGENALSTLARVHLPLLTPTLGAAGLLVFVDAMKELPATLLLRPFNFDTLATHIYGLASLQEFDQAALGALTIVAVGLLPVLLLHRAVASGRAGSDRRS